jgi:hypothetical protein
MKALSGYAEWFWALAMNIKPVENRSWSLASKGIHRSDLPLRIWLHASKTKAPKNEVDFIRSQLTPAQLEQFDAVDWKRLRGCIIGATTIIDEIQADDFAGMRTSPWFFGPFGFMVKDGLLLADPIPYKGQLGFFEVVLPDPVGPFAFKLDCAVARQGSIL